MGIPIFWLGILLGVALLLAFGAAIYAVFFWTPKRKE